MKILFMGTPEFAVASLRALIGSDHDVCCVISQPDRPRGRGRKLEPTPVKKLALKHSIEVLQPEKIRTSESISMIGSFKPDMICVAAYGKIIPPEILEIPLMGCVNVHASLLPKYRGAAPVNWAIINGEKKTGITTMLMDEGMDTGDILLKKETGIGEDETASEVLQRLSEIGAGLLLDTISGLEKGSITPVKQDDEQASYAPLLKKEHGVIDWRQPAYRIKNLVRGLQPWPGTFTKLNGKTLKIHRVAISNQTGKPGEILISYGDNLTVAAGEGSVRIIELQPEGGRRMQTSDFLRGRDISPGTKLG